MDIDREYCKELLIKLVEYYPRAANREFLLEEVSKGEDKYVTNIIYLEQHELLRSGIKFALSGTPLISPPQLVHKGVDFVRNDGGLSAILGVVTVQLHKDTILHILESRIMATDLSPDKKRQYSLGLKELPADAIKHLVMKLVDLGVEKSGSLIDLLKTYF